MSDDQLIMFDVKGAIRMFDPEKFEELVKCIDTEKEYVDKMGSFCKMVNQTMGIVKKLADAIQSEKLKAIGFRNIVESEAEERFRAVQESEQRLGEKQMELDRYVAEYESLRKVEAEQRITIQRLSENFD
ncbi:unnamed protein product [Phytomonas sp. Hart1]|nr:unnamed protein product [Phytomonas sp. Hart1]|eukprot:CCW68081.1 unnamed protein product [Phytomonas sp. isolate Hart1]